MFKVEDILARLHNGEDVDAIAQEMTDALNDANDQFQKEEEAKAKKAAAEAHVKEVRKLQDLQEILDLMHDFCIEYYCDNDEDINTVQAAFATLDAKSVDKMIEEAGAAVLDMEKKLKDIEKLFGAFNAAPVKTIKIDKDFVPGKKNADAVINSFLRSIGL